MAITMAMTLAGRLRSPAGIGRCSAVRWLGLVAVAVLVSSSPAEAKVACDDGTTAFVDGKLRIFGIHYRTPFESGFEEYACLGRRRPLSVGGVGSDSGLGSAVTPVYAHAGRFLASYHQSDGEGGPSAHVSVVDLVSRRSVSFANVACCEWTPSIRLAMDGTVAVLAPGEGVFVKSPGRRARTLAGEDAAPRDLAMHGGTVYWTEGVTAHSARLPGVTGGEARALEPVHLRRRASACAAARGRTLAASGSVRVFVRDGRRVACRVDSHRRFAAAGDRPPRIVFDRWVIVRRGDGVRVIDTLTGRPGPAADHATDPVLQADGGLAYIDEEGSLIGRHPRSGPHLLSGPGGTALAAARRAVYWTRDGRPEVYRVRVPPPD
jgi:hypothetical protein